MALELSVEFGLEDSLKDCYTDDLLYEMVDDPMEAIQKAGAVADVLMDMSATDEDIYYAFLKEALHGENYFNKSEAEESVLNFCIAEKCFMPIWIIKVLYAACHMHPCFQALTGEISRKGGTRQHPLPAWL